MKATIKPPHLPSNITSFTTAIPDNKVVGNTRYENLALSGEDWSEQTASGVVFDECHFQRMNLCGLQLPDLGLSDVLFGECDVANATWPNATLTRVEMVGCRLLGLRANEADVQHLVVKDCNLSLAQFRFATFKWVRFEHCNLHGADFHMARVGIVFNATHRAR